MTVLEKREGSALLRLDETTDDQAVLDAARRAGAVRHFGVVEPTLVDLYREAIGQ